MNIILRIPYRSRLRILRALPRWQMSTFSLAIFARWSILFQHDINGFVYRQIPEDEAFNEALNDAFVIENH